MRKSSQPLTSLATRNFDGLDLQASRVAIESLRAGPHAVRKHTRQQIRAIARSIAEHGFVVPIGSFGDGIIATGHARWEAAKLLGMREVPVIRLDHLTDEQARLYAIADNRVAEGAEWDWGELRAEFTAIAIEAPEIDLDRSGFTIADRDALEGRHRVAELADLDEHAGPEVRPVSRVGDVWALGHYRIACGDATDPVSVQSATEGREVRSVISNPPFNAKIDGNVSGKGKKKHADFVAASGEMSSAEFTSFLQRSVAAMLPSLADGGLLYLFMDHRHLIELRSAAAACDLDYLNLLVWAKNNAGMGSFYRSAHELIGLFKHGAAPHRNTIDLGRFGRNRSNVLHYPGANGFGVGRKQALALHPTVKPVGMIADLIMDSTAPGELVLDSFGGSGTTLIAAEKVGRDAALVELDPLYVDVVIRRFEALTRVSAVHVESGLSFAQITAERTPSEEM